MPQSVWSLLGMLLVVLLILGLAYAATRWLGTAYGGKGGRGGKSGKVLPASLRAGGSERFRVVAQISLGRTERLVLARLGDRCYLLGVTEQGFTLLKELEGGEAQEWLREEESDAAPASFMDVLKDNLRKRK